MDNQTELKEAKFYQKLDSGKVRCNLCPHQCLIYPGRVGICYVRQNRQGKLYALSYGRISAAHLDPIEKKPLYHFHPGSLIYSISTVGCSLGCPFCQNWQLAHPRDSYLRQEPSSVIERITQPLSPQQAVSMAESYRNQGNIGIAYTYNEPLIWYEYLLDTAKLAHSRQLKNILVTNGYIDFEPLEELLPYIDAINMDIKGFSEEFYHRLGGHLEPVLKAAKLAKRYCHLEVTNLLIPSWNTGETEIRNLVNWVADELGSDTPIHFSRFFPARKLNLPPTSLSDLLKAKEIAEERLKYVHLGNVG